MNAILWAVASVAVVITLGEGAFAYPKLPAIVPLRFDIRGRAGRPGPRFVLLGIFSGTAAIIFASLLFTNLETPSKASAIGSLAATLVFLAFAQHLIIDAILNRSERLAMGPFWIGSALIFLFAIAIRTSLL